jgi:hypothetical protein
LPGRGDILDKQYNHAEAFCVMTYRCRKCGTVEALWNSRDGVTPLAIIARIMSKFHEGEPYIITV